MVAFLELLPRPGCGDHSSLLVYDLDIPGLAHTDRLNDAPDARVGCVYGHVDQARHLAIRIADRSCHVWS